MKIENLSLINYSKKIQPQQTKNFDFIRTQTPCDSFTRTSKPSFKGINDFDHKKLDSILHSENPSDAIKEISKNPSRGIDVIISLLKQCSPDDTDFQQNAIGVLAQIDPEYFYKKENAINGLINSSNLQTKPKQDLRGIVNYVKQCDEAEYKYFVQMLSSGVIPVSFFEGYPERSCDLIIKAIEDKQIHPINKPFLCSLFEMVPRPVLRSKKHELEKAINSNSDFVNKAFLDGMKDMTVNGVLFNFTKQESDELIRPVYKTMATSQDIDPSTNIAFIDLLEDNKDLKTLVEVYHENPNNGMKIYILHSISGLKNRGAQHALEEISQSESDEKLKTTSEKLSKELKEVVDKQEKEAEVESAKAKVKEALRDTTHFKSDELTILASFDPQFVDDLCFIVKDKSTDGKIKTKAFDILVDAGKEDCLKK